MRWPDTTSVTGQTPVAGTTPAGPVLFVDRDGVLVVEKDYLCDPDEVELVPGVAFALRRAHDAGIPVVGLSNQSGLGRGRFNAAQFDAVMVRLGQALRAGGAHLDGFYYCPHAPADDCRCRKPRPGLLEEAAAAFTWDPARSWLVGDKISDVDLARATGLRPVLVRTGYGREQESRLGDREGVLVVDNLPAAVTLMLREVAP